MRTRESGHALAGTIVLVLILSVLSTSFTALSSTSNFGYMYTGQSTEAFFAAEAGLEASIKELDDNADTDGNSTIGSIDAVAIGNASVYTTYSGGTLTSYGSAGDTTRVLRVTITN